jgi:hypothetical protein
VFADQRLGVVQGGLVQGGDGAWISQVAEGDTDVAEQAAPFGAADGAVPKAFTEAVVVQTE